MLGVRMIMFQEYASDLNADAKLWERVRITMAKPLADPHPDLAVGIGIDLLMGVASQMISG